MAAQLVIWRRPPGWICLLETMPSGCRKAMLTYRSSPTSFIVSDGEVIYFECGKGNSRYPGPYFFYIERVSEPGDGWPSVGSELT